MENNSTTLGKFANAVAGTEAIEVKATIPEHQIEDALARFGLTSRRSEQRYIYFFDTPKLQLLNGGIIARARRVVGDADDSTIKLRPVDARTVERKWRKYKGFKIETDASEKSLVPSASFSMPVPKGYIKRVDNGKMPIGSIFTKAQKEFLVTMARPSIDLEFDDLSLFGPLTANRWSDKVRGCPWPITAELWKRNDGERLMEVSIKRPAAQAAFVLGGFLAYLEDMGAESDQNEQAKARWVLDHYIAKSAGSPARNAAARQT